MRLLGTAKIRRSGGKHLRILAFAPAAMLAACASFQAHPDPVLDTRAVVASANHDIREVLTAFGDPDGVNGRRRGLDRQQYRNMVVGTLIMAADARYLQFRRRLAAESRGSSLLLDIGILGLSNGASIASEATANALAAGAAGLTGTRAAVSRDVYFDRTIPAMIGIMDAERTNMRTSIMASLRRSAEEYPLAIALSDVAAYEAAASLDGAIEILTREAAERSEDARASYVEEVQEYTRPPEAGVPEIRSRMRNRLMELENAGDPRPLAAIADEIGLTLPAGATARDIRILIQARIRSTSDVARTQELARKIGVPGGEE